MIAVLNLIVLLIVLNFTNFAIWYSFSLISILNFHLLINFIGIFLMFLRVAFTLLDWFIIMKILWNFLHFLHFHILNPYNSFILMLVALTITNNSFITWFDFSVYINLFDQFFLNLIELIFLHYAVLVIFTIFFNLCLFDWLLAFYHWFWWFAFFLFILPC